MAKISGVNVSSITKIAGKSVAVISKVAARTRAEIANNWIDSGGGGGPTCTKIDLSPGNTASEACAGRRFMLFEVGDNGFLYEQGSCGVNLAYFPSYYSDGNGTVYYWNGIDSIYDNAKPCKQ